ncbi:MAG: TonB-dependent receptor [Pedobacter sp.]|nr:MAG: TonB-dependent receptor [Pedobacter sp.]
MTRFILPILALLYTSVVFGQNTFTTTLRDAESKEVLVGATAQVKGTTIGASADLNGKLTINNIPDGNQTITFRYVGYDNISIAYVFPLDTPPVEIFLRQSDAEQLEEVIVTATRTSRTIENTPTRIEVISLEEIDEKSNMRPSNVAMLLHESTGIQVQQTSYTSATATIRIQGLDGKYTQLLKDGFPMFGGFSSGLSILDIPPLDLRQVEIIKGSASTLYGGGSIAGVVNFVSKEPKDKREINIILNQTSALGSDAGIFTSYRKKKVGFTLLTTGHYQKEYDVDKDDFTEIPQQGDFTFNPKIFFYLRDSTRLTIANASNASNRLGGDIHVIQGNNDNYHRYYEKNNSFRNVTYVDFNHWLNAKSRLTVKEGVSYFNRRLQIPDYLFVGTQINSYTDVSYITTVKKHTLVIGGNYIYDDFTEGQDSSSVKRNQTQSTAGVYIQDNWDITDKWLAEMGLRTDYHFTYGSFVLPRVSLLYKATEQLSTRLGAGLGYKAPTIFVEETEALAYKDVAPIDANLDAEQSYGASFDINYRRTILDKLGFSVNHLFFYTTIDKPLILEQDTLNFYHFKNQPKPIQTYGFETNMKFILDPLKLFVGYTFTQADAKYKVGRQFVSLVPQNQLNIALLCEKERKFKIGVEAYWRDKQYLSDGSGTNAYWEFGFFAEKTFGKVSLFVNFENFTDTRQNRFQQVVFPPHENPTFSETWTHTEGFVINGGIKLRL